MRIAIVAGASPARAFPAAALALGLVGNGDEVFLLTGRRYLDRLRQLGVTAHEPDGEPGVGLDHSIAITPALRDRLVEWRPDLIVADVQTPAGGFAAELLDLPWTQLHPHPLGLGADAGQPGVSRGLLRSRARQSQPRPGRYAQRDLAAARDTLGLPPVGRGPLLHMVATLPGLEPSRADWPRNASVVGPLMWDPAVQDLPIPDGHAPLVVVSPSTASADGTRLIDMAVDGLRGVRLVGTVLEPYDARVPSWASIGVGRQEPVLAQAAVVVTGGGHGTIVRALTAGVPLVLAPHAGQQELARRVEQLGAAVVLRRADARSLRRAVERVLEDRRYASAARQVARTVASADPVVLCHQSLVGRSVA